MAAGWRSSLSCHHGPNMVSLVSSHYPKLSFHETNCDVCSVLGWVPGILTMVGAGILFWITSMTMWKFIMKNPQIKDICDFGYYAFGKSRIAYEFTGFMLLANNILLIGFHVLTGAKILNTLSDHSLCTVVFSVITMLMGIVMSIPRTLKHVSFMSMGSGTYCPLPHFLPTHSLTPPQRHAWPSRSSSSSSSPASKMRPSTATTGTTRPTGQ